MSSAMFAIGIIWMALGVIALLSHRVGDGCEMMMVGVLFLIASDVRELLAIAKTWSKAWALHTRKEGD